MKTVMPIIELMHFIAFAILLQTGSRIAHAAELAVHTHTFTIPLPPMAPGQILFTQPGNSGLGRMEMPKGHIAVKR